MSLQSWMDTKERVRQAVDIVDVVGSYLQLRREGRAFKALCPWHDDTRPSLQINPDRQSFKCWVCDIGGDIFSFVMKMEGVGFPEALAMLADRAGIRLEPRERGPDEPASAGDDKRLLYRAMAWASERYHKFLLNDPEAAAVRSYLQSRGIAEASLHRFQLGYSPDRWDWIIEQARQASFAPPVLERVGLVARRRQGGGSYDRFRGRVLFPIFDAQGRVVGLGGRVLPDAAADAAKYVNTPETPLFSKSHLLYGLYAARDAIRRTGTVLVMEGYTDCIVAHQFGCENAVAVLGTALGPDHIKLLRRYTDDPRIVLVLDGDEAGRRRAKEVLRLFLASVVDVRILTLPAELDPCDFLQQRGTYSFEQLIAAAPDALQHAFATVTAGIDLERDVHASTRALAELVETIAMSPRLRADTKVEDRLREEKFLQRLAAAFRVPETQVRELMTQIRRKTSTRLALAASSQASSAASGSVSATAAPADVPDSVAPCERELLEILLLAPDAIGRVGDDVLSDSQLSSAARQVFTTCRRLRVTGVAPDFARLLLEFDDAGIKNLLVACDEQGRLKGSGELDSRLADVLAAFERRRQEPLRKAQAAALQERQLSEADQLALLRQLEQRERTRQGISELTDG